jgi:hypothetical protein
VEGSFPLAQDAFEVLRLGRLARDFARHPALDDLIELQGQPSLVGLELFHQDGLDRENPLGARLASEADSVHQHHTHARSLAHTYSRTHTYTHIYTRTHTHAQTIDKAANCRHAACLPLLLPHPPQIRSFCTCVWEGLSLRSTSPDHGAVFCPKTRVPMSTLVPRPPAQHLP